MNIGIIGFGFVGKGIAHTFSEYDLLIYDKYMYSTDTINETVDLSNVLFVCVPTPMKEDGSQDLSNVADAIRSIVDNAITKKTIVIRTTVTPGTTRHFANIFPQHDFVFMPEFLTERTFTFDSLNPARIVIGGKESSYGYNEVKNLFSERFPSVKLFEMNWEGAEFSKYMCNCFSTVKVSFMNEMYDIAEHLGVEYDMLKEIMLGSGWVGEMHTRVPGPDGERGYGGKCLPKDVEALITWAENDNLHVDMCKTATKVNDRVRVNKNWLDIKGATSKNNYDK